MRIEKVKMRVRKGTKKGKRGTGGGVERAEGLNKRVEKNVMLKRRFY